MVRTLGRFGPNAHKPFTIDDYGKLRKKSYLTYMEIHTRQKENSKRQPTDGKKNGRRARDTIWKY